jgi:Fic family protein
MTYQTTHPWITFRINLERASPQLWMKLGEVASKCEHIAGVPLQPATARRLHHLYLAKGAAATTAIEGNTLTEDEVLKRIEGRLPLPPSREYLGQEVDNIVKACDLIVKGIASGGVVLNSERIRQFNKIALAGLQHENGISPGEIRTYPVVVGNVYRGAPAEECAMLLDRLCEWLNGKEFEAPKETSPFEIAVVYAVLKAIVAHVYLAWIHPFGDGNGRTARLVEFAILMAAGIPQPACHLLSNHYNQTRSRYYQQLDSAGKSGGDLIPFIEYAIQGFVDGLRDQLRVIGDQQWSVSWENYVYQTFRDKKRTGDRRQRELVLALSGRSEPIPMGRITELTPAIAKEYASKANRTLVRDLKELERLGLIEKTPEGIRAKREIILAFLPWRKR